VHKFLLRVGELLSQRIDELLDALDFAVTGMNNFRVFVFQEIHPILRLRQICAMWAGRVDDHSDLFLDVACALSLLLLQFRQFVCRRDDFLVDRSLLFLNINIEH
jgi:hypothetical protein